MAIPTFEEIVKATTDFVTMRKGVWDHAAWLDFFSDMQKQGFQPPDLEIRLGDALESMKRFYSAIFSIQRVEKAMTDLTMDSAEFVSKQKGVWGHAEWEAFAEHVNRNTVKLSEETTMYLGGILESLKGFYQISAKPVSAAKKTPGKTKGAQATGKTAKKPPEAEHVPDDLTAISGIGPALQKKLNARGLYSYAQIAALSDDNINELEKTIIKFPGRIKRDNWVAQAKKLIK